MTHSKHVLTRVLFLGLLVFGPPLFSDESQSAPASTDPWSQFIESHWSKSFGQCLMTDEEFLAYQTQWQNFRILSTIRYDLLLEHWFKNQTPKQSAVEIDSAFQFQKIEPYMINGATNAEKSARVEKAIGDAIASELTGGTIEEFRKRFGLLKSEWTAYLQIMNNDSLMAPPYNGHEGFSVLFQNLWRKKAIEKGSSWNLDNYKLSVQDMKAIDAVARTLWSEASQCKQPMKGAYQALARVIIDRSKLCDSINDVSVEYCSSDRRLKESSAVEKVIGKSLSFESWRGGKFDQFPSQSKKSGTTWVKNFYKLSRENTEIKKGLCPTSGLSEEELAQLKSVYVMTLKALLDTPGFEKQWVWPERRENGNKENFSALSSYIGVGRKMKSKIKTVSQILDSTQQPPATYDLKKHSTSQCQLASFVKEL